MAFEPQDTSTQLSYRTRLSLHRAVDGFINNYKIGATDLRSDLFDLLRAQIIADREMMRKQKDEATYVSLTRARDDARREAVFLAKSVIIITDNLKKARSSFFRRVRFVLTGAL